MSKARIIRVTELNTSEKHALLKLHQHYYENVKSSVFYKDLEQKDFLIVIYNDREQISGFSTIQLIWLEIDDLQHLFLFSGDTVVKEEVRNSPVLAGGFAYFLHYLIKTYPENPKHWFLITKGYRTYRFLPVYFKEFYPTYNRPFSLMHRKILDAIAMYKFGNQYNPEDQIIRYYEEKDHLKPEFAEIPGGKLKNPDVAFFYLKNPGFIHGNEFACIADISESNLKPLVGRILNNTKVSFKEIVQ